MNNFANDDIKRFHQWLCKAIDNDLMSIAEFTKELEEKDVVELSEYIHTVIKSHHKRSAADMDKLKVFVSLMNLPGADVKRILSYLESTGYGWHGNKYILNNSCLRFLPSNHCKKKSSVGNTEMATDILHEIYDIFFDKEYGNITLFIFNYCLTALFIKRLHQDGFSMPFFLQIACDRNSVLYQLIEKIVEICDVNSGLFNNCTNVDHAHCGYIHQTYYPTQFTAKDLDDLIHNNKDIPVIIAGHENERYYHALLREIVNIPTKKNVLGLKDRFYFLPLFICSMIKSSFDNVFDIDLTELEVSKDYLNLLRENEKMLVSWVLDLVTESEDRLLLQKDVYSSLNKHPFSGRIKAYINYVSQNYPDITLNNAKNVGLLNFFFKGYMRVFNRLCTFSIDEKFACFEHNGEWISQTIEKNIAMLTDLSERQLAEFHRRYLPSPSGASIHNKEAARLAKQIEKRYRELKVFIRVIIAEVKEDRYIFNIDTLQETKDTDVGGKAGTVQRRLKKYDCFKVDLRDKKSIKLIVAEKPLEDNSLIEILKHEDFANSKMEIPYAVGFDETGNMCIEDLAKFPHLLLAGATRSGKSTAIKSLLMSIAYKYRTGDVNVLLMDFLGKQDSDFAIFNNQPFLSSPVITSPKVGLKAILSLHEEMKKRMQDKNLSDMPYIVCVIDEFPRLFAEIEKEYEESLEFAMTQFLSGSRHTKIHLVLAAQDPKKEHIVCGIGNITARIALRCGHYKNSVTILGRSGADKLIGAGKMIFDSPSGLDKRLQGSFIKETDMGKLLDEIKETYVQKNKYPFKFDEMILTSDLMEMESGEAILMNPKTSRSNSEDEKLPDAIMWSLSQNQIANSRLQDYLKIGNNRASRILKRMEELCLLEKMHGKLGWAVVPNCIEDMSVEVIKILGSYGRTEIDINSALLKRSSK
jgi:S-DNA-T family DNA segregation ATPase FtsK/SpoIIIE